MLLISLSSSAYSLCPDPSCLFSSSSSLIVSIVLLSLTCPPFHLLQFLSNLAQYSSSYLLSVHPNNFFAVNLPGNSPLVNTPLFSPLSCLLISSISLWYSFSNSLTTSFAFSKFFFFSQVSDFAVKPFYHTRYLFFPLTHYLFSIFSTSYFSSPLMITGAGCSFLCLSTCPTYFCILLTLTTRCIFIVLDSSNSTVFNNIIFLIL